MKKLNKSIVATLVLTTVLALNTQPAQAASTVTPTRIGGVDRYETSLMIAKEYQKATIGTSGKYDGAVLATGEDFPDALSGAPLAAVYGGPLLLVEKYATTPNATATLSYVKSTVKDGGEVNIIGGTGVIDASFDANLDKLRKEYLDSNNTAYVTGVFPVRRYGSDRYETSYSTFAGVRGPNKSTVKVYVVTGENFADALSISSKAAQEKAPIVMVNGATISNYLNISLDNSMEWESTISDIVIVGGTGVVSAEIETKLKEIVPAATFTRIAGVDRYATAAEVYNSYYKNATKIYVASGDSYPDALSAAPLAALTNSPVVLVDNKTGEVSPEVTKYLSSLTNPEVIVLGGTGAVSEQLVSKVVSLVSK